MPKRTVQDIVNNLSDNIKSLVRKRENIILEIGKIDNEIKVLVEQQLSLDPSRIKILCMPPPLGCGGKGYIEGDDGKKRMCPICGGPDSPYIWATVYKEPVKDEASKSDS